MDPQNGLGGGNPLCDGPAIPPPSFQFATFNARRLWQRDQSAHNGFHMLSEILSAEGVDVLCIQEVFAGDFPRLPVNQPYSYDGPSEFRGCEAGFLVHNGVSSAKVPGVPDSLSVRWRIFAGVVCVCSFYAPHAGIAEAERVQFWQDLVAMARRVHIEVRLPMIVAGDANVWHPHFNLGRSRSADNMIVPFIDLLLSSCGLVLCNPRDRATHNAGAALDLVCASSSSPVTVRVHDGDNCCSHAPACCPLLGSDHFLCVGTTSFPRPEVSDVPRGIPLLRDWRPTLLRAFSQLSLWSEKILLQSSTEQPLREVDRTSILDGLYTEMLSILTAHSPAPRQHSHRRRQPAWWDADCLAACVARNGALRDHHRVRSEESYMRFSAARQQFHRTVRATRRNFWSLWQDHVSSLSVHNPRVAASIIRRTFQQLRFQAGGARSVA